MFKISSMFWYEDFEFPESELPDLYDIYEQWCYIEKHRPEMTKQQFLNNPVPYFDHVLFHAQCYNVEYVNDFIKKYSNNIIHEREDNKKLRHYYSQRCKYELDADIGQSFAESGSTEQYQQCQTGNHRRQRQRQFQDCIDNIPAPEIIASECIGRGNSKDNTECRG